MQYITINNQLIASSKAFISVQDRGFRYGDSVFETIAVHTGVPYQFDWHMERLRKGLHAVRIEANLHTLHEQCRELLRANKVNDGILRIQISRGIGSKGYLPDAAHKEAGTSIIIETMKQPDIPSEPVSLWQSSYSKPSSCSLPVQYKLGQGLNSTLARIEAAENQCFDALLLNDEGHICETSSANIFWLDGDALYTPSLHCGVLEGSMRATIIRLSNIPVKEVEASIDDLTNADGVFISNVTWKILPVKSLTSSDASWPTATKWEENSLADSLNSLIRKDIISRTKNNSMRW